MEAVLVILPGWTAGLRPEVAREVDVAEPVTPGVLIKYMMGKKLQFAPGE